MNRKVSLCTNIATELECSSARVDLRLIASASQDPLMTDTSRTSPHPDREAFSPSEQYTPFPARKWVILLFVGWNGCLVVALVVLWVLSHLRNGLFAVNLQLTDALLPWHLVPTIIGNVNALGFSAIGTASLFCQPYILMQREGGVNGGELLSLDYSASLPLVAIRAIRKRHWISLFLSVAVLSVLCL